MTDLVEGKERKGGIMGPIRVTERPDPPPAINSSAPMFYVIHVNRQHIAYNAKAGKDVLPVYTTKQRRGPTVYSFGINIHGPSTLVDPREHNQLSCGARAWIETNGPVEFIDQMSYAEAMELKKQHQAEQETP